MRRSSLAIVAIATLGLATLVHAQQRPSAPASSKGVNVGSLSCNVAGGAGFVFGSSKALSCIFTRTDGSGERYVGDVRRFGIDIGYTEEAQIVWLVFAPGNVARRRPCRQLRRCRRCRAPSSSARRPTSWSAETTARSLSSRSASKAAQASTSLAAWPRSS